MQGIVATRLTVVIPSKYMELKPREIQVLKYRMQKLTLEQVAMEFGVTRERIRQIEAKALGKIRQQDPKELYETLRKVSN